MLETYFFEKFCADDTDKGINALIEFKDSIAYFLNLYAQKLDKIENLRTYTKADVIQEVTIKLWEKQAYLCKKNKNGDFKNGGFKRFFITSVKNKVIDILRKEKKINAPIKYSIQQIKEAIWQQEYNVAKEDLLLTKGQLSPLEFETVKIFCLHKVFDCFKLLVTLNILLEKNNWHYDEMKRMKLLHHQIPYNEKLNEYLIFDVYKMKKDDLIKLLQLSSEEIEEYREVVRKFKQFIKRKLQRKNLWKHIHLTI